MSGSGDRMFFHFYGVGHGWGIGTQKGKIDTIQTMVLKSGGGLGIGGGLNTGGEGVREVEQERQGHGSGDSIHSLTPPFFGQPPVVSKTPMLQSPHIQTPVRYAVFRRFDKVDRGAHGDRPVQ